MDEQARREIGHLREVLEARMDGMDRALKLQAQEYERRLDLLNHTRAEERRILDQAVTQDRFDAYKAFQEERDDTARRMQWAAMFTALLAMAGWIVQWGFRP